MIVNIVSPTRYISDGSKLIGVEENELIMDFGYVGSNGVGISKKFDINHFLDGEVDRDDEGFQTVQHRKGKNILDNRVCLLL